MSICAVCGENRVPPNMRRCTGCGAWNQNETGIVGEVNEKSVISLSDVSAAKISRIITTGPWDEVWGGGFVPGSCTLLGGSAGMGKAVALHTTIATATGWTTMGEIQVGESVFDEHGRPCRVVFGSDVMTGHPCYRVTFSKPGAVFGTDPEATILADEDHLWAVTPYDGESVIRTTKDLIGRGPITVESRGQKRHITSVEPVDSVPVRCIAVDSPSHLYLAGHGMVATHNTSIMLMLMSIFCKLTGKLGYYIGAEQAASELRLTADRFQIDNLDRIKVLREFGSGADIDRELMKKHPPCCVVVDSVSAMCGKDKDAALAVAKKHKRLAVEFNCLSFLICHMNKEGDFAGLYALQHEVDTIITIFGPMDHEREVAKLARDGHSDDTLDGLRVLMPWKNRYGPTGKEVFLTMGPHGLHALPPLEKKGKRGKDKETFLLPPESPPSPEAGPPAAPSAAIVAQAQRKLTPPETLVQDGQKLVRRVKGARGKPEKAVEGEALKKRRAPMARAAKKATKSAKPTKVAKKAVKRQEPKKRASKRGAQAKKGSARTKGART